jgi:hypothetical protein
MSAVRDQAIESRTGLDIDTDVGGAGKAQNFVATPIAGNSRHKNALKPSSSCGERFPHRVEAIDKISLTSASIGSCHLVDPQS